MDIGLIVGGFLLGFIVRHFTPRWSIWGSMILTAVIMAILYLLVQGWTGG